MKNKKEKNIIIIFLTTIIIFIALGISLLWNNSNKKNSFEDPNAVAYNSEIKKPVDFSKKQIVLPGFSTIKVDYGSTRTNVALSNPSFNRVLFKYSVVLVRNHKEDKLIETEMISPGKAVVGFNIPKGLPKGKYPLKIQVKTFDISSHSPLNGGDNDAVLEVV